ncbi:Glutaryl-CoA dehydrogenase [Posidoniimonas polymericola]|uniref:Glutaryl-CoA dehydrogenase n=1 Tax=Posidoniimonas polymericola TaxID=2528002 RepID=A0A5C5YTD3_9BACT|nr:acyl-CoA dehydrogenase family protein [Posidoniimonas polymericola]TWT78040.1 Glutaryl-CoA dehydrogenase [Posidoniimonas polymericola]
MHKITSPDSPALAALCQELASRADATDASGEFPAEQIRLCGEAGVYEWFLAPEWGGQAWTDADIVRGYLELSRACLSTTFAITQRTGACRRIAGGGNDQLKQRLLPGLATADSFATVGISHLTTSGRHLAEPMLAAEPVDGGWRLTGRAPWVTGGVAADWLVLGASIVDQGDATGEEVLLATPTDADGLTVGDRFELVGVTASSTGPVVLEGVFVPTEQLINGPAEKVMSIGRGGNTGGYETSTLALGLASAAIGFLGDEATRRNDLRPAHQRLAGEAADLEHDLLAVAAGEPACSNESLRTRANSLVLRATQAALSAAKGRGYVAGHPVGRWCREALFFMVWSCPAPVANANLCELAGIAE